MAEKRRRPLGLYLIGGVLLLMVVYYATAEVTWQRPSSTNDSEHAVVQPAEAPPPGGVATAPAPTAGTGNPASRGQSSVRGDGTSLNDSTIDSRPPEPR